MLDDVSEIAASQPAERALLETVERVLRRPSGWVALVLHLSRLADRRPYHGRIARAVLAESAPRAGGQMHVLSNGDLLLFCDAGEPSPARLLERLFSSSLISTWRLEDDALDLIAYAAGRLTEAAGGSMPGAQRAGTEPLVRVPEFRVPDFFAERDAISAPMIAGLFRRQSGLRLIQGGMQLAFRDLAPDLTRLPVSDPASEITLHDGALRRHCLAVLDPALLGALSAALGSFLPLDIAASRLTAAWHHLPLALSGVLSEDFARFAAQSRRAGVRLGVVVDLAEALTDPGALEAARSVIAQAGARFVLGGIGAATLACFTPASLEPDLLLLDYSPDLEGLRAEAEQLFAPHGPAHVALRHADSEAALAWGVARGITVFQGRHVDAMLGAARMLSCPDARACTLGQCINRAAAAEPAGRFGCTRPALLNGLGRGAGDTA